jgi:hypothetical protein
VLGHPGNPSTVRFYSVARSRNQNGLMPKGRPELSHRARLLRGVHNAIGAGELGCLAYLWLCAIVRRRDRWLRLSVGVLVGEGVALVAFRGCPFGVFQRRVGDDVPMFELWFGPRLSRFAIPFFTASTGAGIVLLIIRRADSVPEPSRDRRS